MHQHRIFFLFLLSLLVDTLSIAAQDRINDSLLFESLKQKAERMFKSNELLSLNQGVHYMAIDLTENYEFCIKENDYWYAIESSLKDGSRIYNQTRYDQNLASDSSSYFPDSVLSNYVKALQLAHGAMLIVNDTLNFLWENHIFKQNDSLFEVIFLPAFQPSGQAIYGITLDYIVNAAANKISSSLIHFSGLKTLWIGQPRSIWLNYRTKTEPEIGGVYFAWNYKDYFTKTYLDLKDRTYILEKNKTGIYSWTVRYK